MDIINTILSAFGPEDESIDKIKSLDLTNKKDLEFFINTANSLKEECKNNSCLNGLFDIDSILNDLIKNAQNIYAKSHKDDEVKATPTQQCASCKREVNDCSCGQKFLDPPSTFTSEKHKQQIMNLVSEYVNTYVSQYSQDKVVLDNVSTGLFEFACWMMNK